MAKTSRRKAATKSMKPKIAESHAPSRTLGVAGVEWTRATVSIAFGTEAQLIRKLRALLSALEPGGEDAPKAGVAGALHDAAALSDAAAPAVAAGQCLDILTATQIIVDALQGKPFEPQKPLGETFLSPNERDAFRDRVRSGVIANGCSIGLAEIPNGAGTSQGEVRDAIKQRAK